MSKNPLYFRFKFTFKLLFILHLSLICQPALARGTPCVEWAKDKVQSVLTQKFNSQPVLELRGRINTSFKLKPDGYEIIKLDNRIVVLASNARGAMYGMLRLHDLARASDATSSSDFLTALEEEKFEPQIKIRADNPFLHLTPKLNITDTKMWKHYIDQLAENRFNTIDFHGAFDPVTTEFPNLFPLLVSVEGFAQIGNKNEQTENLKALQDLTVHAKNRCVDVGLMNYTANAPGLDTTEIETYTAAAVTKLINEVPFLKFIGFRVGESGRESSFFKNAYLKGIQNSKHPTIGLYTRSWQTSKSELEKIGADYGKNFIIEIKYNGEQLGLPYQAIHEGGASYSYQDYLTPKTSYDVLWQVRANGTHRFFSWMNTDFIKQAVKSFEFGDALGFSLESHSSYFPMDAKTYFDNASDQTTYEYIFDKNWMWFSAWGRLAYNPNDKFLSLDFQEHFGKEHQKIEQALESASHIIPLIYSYRYQGPDHRNFSPETETGNFWVTNSDDHHYFYPGHRMPDLLSFSGNKPMDQRAFVGIDEFVANKLSNTSDGRISPIVIANTLKNFANTTQSLLQTIDDANITSPQEWKILKNDLLSLIHLASYYHHRILALTQLSLAIQTNNSSLLIDIQDGLKKSRLAWAQLAATADAQYAPLVNLLRINAPLPSPEEAHYQWSSQLSRLEKLDASLDFVWRNTLKPTKKSADVKFDWTETRTQIFKLAELKHSTISENSVKIETQIKSKHPLKTASLWYKSIPSESKWRKHPMTLTDQTYSATIPKNTNGVLYLVEVCDVEGHCRNLPDVFTERPWRVQQ